MNESSLIFCCPLCKKWKNLNRRKKVIGFLTWKTIEVCEKCFTESGLAGVGE